MCGRFVDPNLRNTEAEMSQIKMALLHKSDDGRGSPFPGRIYPTVSVTGMPRAV